MDAETALAAFGGAARWSEIRLVGVAAGPIRAGVATGRILHIGRGVYALPEAPPEARMRARFAAPLTCCSALLAVGLPVLDAPEHAHLAVPRDLHVKSTPTRDTSAVRIHRGNFAMASVRWGEIPRVTIGSALGHATACLTSRSLVAATDAALNSGAIDFGDLAFPEKRAASKGRWLASVCDRAAQSPLESLARLELRAAGLEVATQVLLPGVGRVDFVVEDLVVVEVDGRAHHSDAERFADDRRRDIAAQELGLLVARFTYADVVTRPGRVSATVKRLLRSPARRHGGTQRWYPVQGPTRRRGEC